MQIYGALFPASLWIFCVFFSSFVTGMRKTNNLEISLILLWRSGIEWALHMHQSTYRDKILHLCRGITLCPANLSELTIPVPHTDLLRRIFQKDCLDLQHGNILIYLSSSISHWPSTAFSPFAFSWETCTLEGILCSTSGSQSLIFFTVMHSGWQASVRGERWLQICSSVKWSSWQLWIHLLPR